MKEITRLVNEWDVYEEKTDNPSIAEFCQYFLNKEKLKSAKEKLFHGNMPPHMGAALGKLISRLAAINAFYFKNGLRESRELDLDTFSILNAIFSKGEARKTEIIHESFMELSTGTDHISRLISKGIVSERQDPQDKRARLIKLTPQGEQLLHASREDAATISNYIYGELTENDKAVLFSSLNKVDIKHSQLINEHRGQDISKLITEKKGQKSSL